MVGNIGILYEDPYILVCRKPAGVPVQSANARVKDMVSILKLYLLEESGKPGEPYLGVVHRLDQPVQGVIVFATLCLQLKFPASENRKTDGFHRSSGRRSV